MMAIALLAERRASGRKVASLTFDSSTSDAIRSVLGKDTLLIFPIKDKQPVVVIQPDQRYSNKTQKNALRWCR